jgi:hypothetical protein
MSCKCCIKRTLCNDHSCAVISSAWKLAAGFFQDDIELGFDPPVQLFGHPRNLG